MSSVKPPVQITIPLTSHEQWLKTFASAEILVKEDKDLQLKAAKGLRLKERRLPPEVLGRMYAQYCDIINRMYVTYAENLQLQRAPYLLEIIGVLLKRMFELRNELVHLILNDYIFVDSALIQTLKTPYDIQVIVPYHFSVLSRPEAEEMLLQKMIKDAFKRKNKPPKKVREPKPAPSLGLLNEDGEGLPPKEEVVEEADEEESEEDIVISKSIHTMDREEYINALIIQKHERFRKYFMLAYKRQCRIHKLYFAPKIKPAPRVFRERAAAVVQKFYRQYMHLKREHLRSIKRDVFLGIIPDVDRRPLSLKDETNKMFERRLKQRNKMLIPYAKDFERENTRLIRIGKDNVVDDITEEIREWFRDWYYGYEFFPQYPYVEEEGTVLVINGQYQTIEEKKAEDEAYIRATKGKTKEMMKQEKEQAKFEALMKAEAEADRKKKEADALFKARCNPPNDPGYEPKQSDFIDDAIKVLRRYRLAWSIYDQFDVEKCKDIIYGYMIPVLDEDIMQDMHLECRKYVDEMMRLELKLFIQAQKLMYNRVGWKYPKFRPRKRPKMPNVPKPFAPDSYMLNSIEAIFDLGIVSKPTVKLDDVYGDLSYAAYDYNVDDPNARFPSPGYGDVKRRLVFSCIFGSGMEPNSPRNKSVMLVGIPANGKSQLVDAVAGEMNAVKFDISPEVFSSKCKKPAKLLNYVFQAARVFQPSVIYLRNIERVFYKKVPHEERKLKSKALKRPLQKLIKTAIATESKVILIATCSQPFLARQKPMVKMFSEIIVVPKPDYGSLYDFFQDKMLKIRSMPQDYCAHALARAMDGFGFGVAVKAFNEIMTSDRIVRLNFKPFSAMEFVDYLIERDLEPMTDIDYQKYFNFYIQYSTLKAARIEYAIINATRAYVYNKLAQKKADDEANKAAEK